MYDFFCGTAKKEPQYVHKQHCNPNDWLLYCVAMVVRLLALLFAYYSASVVFVKCVCVWRRRIYRDFSFECCKVVVYRFEAHSLLWIPPHTTIPPSSSLAIAYVNFEIYVQPSHRGRPPPTWLHMCRYVLYKPQKILNNNLAKSFKNFECVSINTALVLIHIVSYRLVLLYYVCIANQSTP